MEGAAPHPKSLTALFRRQWRECASDFFGCGIACGKISQQGRAEFLQALFKLCLAARKARGIGAIFGPKARPSIILAYLAEKIGEEAGPRCHGVHQLCRSGPLSGRSGQISLLAV